MIPVALTIAGSDSGGGAGIQADLKTFAALQVFGVSAISALTAQNTQGVFVIEAVSPAFVVAQLDAIYADFEVSAVKLGMMSDVAVISQVADFLRQRNKAPIVFDPVMVATSGDVLVEQPAVAALKQALIPLSGLITPNVHEAAHLLASDRAKNTSQLKEQAVALLSLGAKAVLLKGGHIADDGDAVDVLARAGTCTAFRAPWIETTSTHGTGCTLSSAIAARLARGDDLLGAVSNAKLFTNRAIAGADRLGLGKGYGPIHHFHTIWEET